MQKNFDNFSIQDVMRLAKSPAGQQLLAMLQRTGGDQLQQAATLASEGNYTQAQQLLSSLLSNPEAQALLSKLRG